MSENRTCRDAISLQKKIRVAAAHHAVFDSARVEMIRRKGIRPCA